MKHINLNNRVFGFNNDSPFVLIAGPCQVESLQHSIDMCGLIREIAMTYEVPFVFKSSFDKANRTSANSKRGAGLDLSMDIFEYLQKEFDDVPLITDIHTEEQTIISQVVDIIQIPAFLSRQTDLLVAAAMTNKPVMIKKGQFMALKYSDFASSPLALSSWQLCSSEATNWEKLADRTICSCNISCTRAILRGAC